MLEDIHYHQNPDVKTNLKIQVVVNPGSLDPSLYTVSGFDTKTNQSCPFTARYGKPADHMTVLFQRGSPLLLGENGVTLEALLAICQHRLENFQASPFACEENQEALDHIRSAIKALHLRSSRRQHQNILGTQAPDTHNQD